MNNLEFILSCLKTSHYRCWAEDKLEECKQRLKTLNHEELRTVRHSRWMREDNELYPALFELLYQNELQDVVRKLNAATTEELIREFRSTKSAYKKDKIPEILLDRYDSMDEAERQTAFKILLKRGLVEKEEQ